MLQKKTSKPAKAKTSSFFPKSTKTIAQATKKARKSIEDIEMLQKRNAILDGAIKRFRKPHGWIEGNLALDENGHVIDVHKINEATAQALKEGHSFCALGAVGAEAATHGIPAAAAAVKALSAALPEGEGRLDEQEGYDLPYGESVFTYNNSHTKRGVIGLFKRAKKQPL